MSYPATIPTPAHRPASFLGAARSTARPAAAPAASPYGGQAARYRESELMSATPGQLVVMLFDKILLTIRRARVAIEGRNIEERCENVCKAHEMITELRVTLDHEAAPEMSGQLDALYAFMLQELAAANRLQDVKKLDVVLHMASELRAAFSGAVQQLAAGTAAAPAARIA